MSDNERPAIRTTKTDRRSSRTRRLLVQGLVEVMRGKRYHSVTVQEIVDRADVGRSTFYAHFTDKDDLLTDGVRHLLASLETEAVEPHRIYPTLGLLHHLGAEPDLYRIMAKDRGLTVFLNALQNEITATLTARLTERATTAPTVSPPLLAAMITSMLITAIRTWIEGGLTSSATSVDNAFHTLAAAAIEAGMRPSPN